MIRKIMTLLILLTCAHGLGAGAVWAGCKVGAVIKFELQLDARYKALSEAFLSASRLHEQDGNCVRSLRRIDSNLRADIDRFKKILRSRGYYGNAVNYRSEQVENRIKIYVSVLPGEQYLVDSVSIDYWNAAGEKLSGIEGGSGQTTSLVQVSKPAIAADIVKAEERLLRTLKNKGYPFAEILERKVVVDHQSKRVTVTYNMAPGVQSSFGEVRFSGLETIKKSYLLGLRPWAERDTFQLAKLEDYRSRLMETGLFNSVQSELSAAADEPAVDIALTTKESLHRRIELGAGYATGQGMEFEAGWTHRNLFGAGETFKLGLVAGDKEQELSTRFKKPNWLRYDQSLILTAKGGIEDTPAFERDYIETYSGIERRLSKNMTGTVGVLLKAENIEQVMISEASYLTSAPLELIFDHTNSVLDPSRGFRVNLRTRPTLLVKGGNSFFVASELISSVYGRMKALDRIVWASRFRLGSIVGAPLDGVPASERFYAGGGGSVRGFSYQRLGPKLSDGSPEGGRSVAEVSFEARVRVSQSVSVVPFVDGGMVYASRLPNLGGFRWGAGLGLRYYTSFAPLRFDVAVPLDRRIGENKFTFYISIGQSF